MPSFKLLGLWIDDNLKGQTNTDYIIRKAVKRLFLLKVLKKYGASRDDMKRFLPLLSDQYLNMVHKSGMVDLLKRRVVVLRRYKEGH